jgi:hypothetical protein
MVGEDLSGVWHWLRDNDAPLGARPTLSLYPQPLSVRDWLRAVRSAARTYKTLTMDSSPIGDSRNRE